MTRIKRGTLSVKKRKKLLSYTKGFKWGRKSKKRLAKEALLHAWVYAFRDRKKRKEDFRRLWQMKINAASREVGISYSQFVNMLKKANVQLDRKILAQLAEFHSEVFKKIIEEVKSS